MVEGVKEEVNVILEGFGEELGLRREIVGWCASFAMEEAAAAAAAAIEAMVETGESRGDSRESKGGLYSVPQ